MQPSIDQLYGIFLRHPVISTDSRKIIPGSLFFALKGEQFDGNLFVSEALEKGAAYVVTSHPGPAPDDRYLLVADPLIALQEIAAHHRRQFSFPVIAVTGTNGKTTTKELITAVLSKKYNCLSTEGNLNNHIGVPLTLLKIRPETGIAVIEMGANHAGEIDRLCKIAQPNFGIITNIGKAHLEGFGSFGGVIAAKSELYRHIAREGTMLFVNRDDALLNELAEGIPQIQYSSPDHSCYQGQLVSSDPFVVLDLIGTTAKTRINSRLFGAYNFYNILAAASIGNFFGVRVEAIKEAIEGYTPVNNRSQVVQGKRNLLILDAYNANPSSMAAALQNFARSGYADKMIILGDMLELGTESVHEHREILRMAAELGLHDALFIGPVFASLPGTDPSRIFGSSQAAREYLLAYPFSGKTILIKGSRGMKLEVVKDAL